VQEIRSVGEQCVSLLAPDVGPEPQGAHEPERLVYGERRVAAVLLHHVRARRPKVRAARLAVQSYIPLDDANSLGVGEDVEEGGLAAATRAHNSSQRPRQQDTTHALQYVQLRPAPAGQLYGVVNVAKGNEGGPRGAPSARQGAVHPPAAAARDPAV